MRVNKNFRGFTLIELSLSLIFIATLSLIIALLINNTVSSYRRGLVLNQINTVGMDIVDDMRAAVQNSSTKSVISNCNTLYSDTADILACEESGGASLVSVVKTARIELSAEEVLNNIPVYGAFCTGAYSYIWNSGYFYMNKNGEFPRFTGADKAVYTYGNNTVNTVTDFRLLKVKDNSRAVCIAANQSGLTGNEFDVRSYGNVMDEEPIDLLKSDDLGMALYDLTVSTPADSNALNSLFYSVSFVLGTVQSGINVSSTSNFCSTPNDYENSNMDYCAINKFNFAARATGE